MLRHLAGSDSLPGFHQLKKGGRTLLQPTGIQGKTYTVRGLLDGELLQPLAIECDGTTIETAENVAAEQPELIEAYVMNHCMQCGYCTPGFVMTAKALIDRIAKPTEQDIRDALGGNICRCGTYPQHILAIREATAKNTA